MGNDSPVRDAGPRPLELDGLLREMVRRGASDLHITAGHPPVLRINGALTETGSGQRLLREDTRRLAYSILSPDQRERFKAEDDLDFSFEVQELARFRGNCFRQRGCIALAIRQIPYCVTPLNQLGMPPVLNHLARQPRGLVLVTGPTGSGKSTTLAAMVDKINRERQGHIIAIEDPIEFVHQPRRCIVSQREIGGDTRSFAAALKHALRQDPDVILIGEMRDSETTRAALTIAETGHLVLATLHTSSAAESINRIIDTFPYRQQTQARKQLAAVLQGVVTQILLPRDRRRDRVAAVEVMVCTPAIRAVVRDEKVHQIHSLMQAGKKHGMQTLDEALAKLYLNGEVALEEALKHSTDPSELLRSVGEPAPDGFHQAESTGWYR